VFSLGPSACLVDTAHAASIPSVAAQQCQIQAACDDLNSAIVTMNSNFPGFA
jgi:hypothetical protein